MDENSLISINGNGDAYLTNIVNDDNHLIAAIDCGHDDFFYENCHHPVLHEKCDWCSADSSQYGPHRACAVSYLIYYESGAERNQ